MVSFAPLRCICGAKPSEQGLQDAGKEATEEEGERAIAMAGVPGASGCVRGTSTLTLAALRSRASSRDEYCVGFYLSIFFFFSFFLFLFLFLFLFFPFLVKLFL